MAAGSAPGLLSSLRHRDWARYVAAFSISSIGSWSYGIALAVWLVQVTGSAGWLAVAAAARLIPAALCSAYAGVVAERFERVWLLVRVDLIETGLMVLIAVEMLIGLPPLVVLVTAGCSSAIATVYEPAAAATTPLLVPEQDLGSANTLRNTIDNVCVVAGPALGAGLLMLGPAWVALAVNAASFAVSAALICRIETRSVPVDVTEGGTAGPLQQMLVGISTITESRSTVVLIGFCLLVTFADGADVVLRMVISDRLLGTGAEGYGYLLAGLGVGGVLMAPLAARMERLSRLGPMLLGATVVFCLPTLAYLGVDQPLIGFVIEGVRGAAVLVVDVLAVTALQRSLPGDRLARVFGAIGALCLLTVLAGSALVPLSLELIGLTGTLWVAGVGIPLLSLLGVPNLLRMDREAAARRATLRARVEVLGRLDLFAEVGDGGLDQLAGSADFVEVAAGRCVVREGEAADAFFAIVTGVFVATANRVELRRMGPGDHFGEIGIIEAVPRTATVTAADDGRLLRVEGAAFATALIRGAPSLALLDVAGLRLGATHAGQRMTRAGLHEV